jgi:TolA-binding protein
MQARIARGPHFTLGIAEPATPEQVRAAFLELTKRFHPARFGRLAPDVQRMATEVFLGIKGAHDSVLKALGAPTRRGAAFKSGSMSALEILPAAKSTGSIPTVRPAGTQPPGGVPTPQASAAGSQPLTMPRTLTPTRPPIAARTVTPSSRPPQPAPTPPAPTSAQAPRPATARPAVPQPEDLSPPTERHAGVPAAWNERAAYQDALDLLGARDWAAAKTALNALATRVPQSRPYKALLSYARGREMQAAGKRDEAAREYERALQLDPAMPQAKLALAELTRK